MSQMRYGEDRRTDEQGKGSWGHGYSPSYDGCCVTCMIGFMPIKICQRKGSEDLPIRGGACQGKKVL